MPRVLEYLQSLSTKLSVSTVLGYLTAITSRHARVKLAAKSYRLSKLSSVQTWVRGLRQLKTIPRKIIPEWSLELVLKRLKLFPFHPAASADLKHLTLKAVFLVAITSARRASELHAIRSDTLQFSSTGVSAFTDPRFVPKVASEWHCNQPIELPSIQQDDDQALRPLCVRAVLKHYINRTMKSRRATGATQLFLCYGGKARGHPVSIKRISQWLKEVIYECYALDNLPPPSGVKGHQVRKQAVSYADMAGVSPQVICDSATWGSSCVFAKHYSLDLTHRKRSDFGRQILTITASTSAEASMGRNLSAVTAPPSAPNPLAGFRIPKLPGTNSQSKPGPQI